MVVRRSAVSRRTLFLLISIAMFSTLALASVPAGHAFLSATLFPAPEASQAANLAILGAGLLCAARWLQSERP